MKRIVLAITVSLALTACSNKKAPEKADAPVTTDGANDSTEPTESGVEPTEAPTESAPPPTQPVTTRTTAAPTTTEAATTTVAPPLVMPDFTGRNYDEVATELAAMNARITRRLKISAEVPGAVLEQIPAPGAPFRTSIELVVSTTPPAVPDLVGKTFGEAERTLREQGFAVVEQPSFDEQKADGLVLQQDPAPGTPNIGEVSLSVARRPAVLHLYDLERVNGSAERSAAKINAEFFPKSLLYGSPNYTEYDLSRSFRRLVGTLGVLDNASSDKVCKFQFSGDSRSLAVVDAGFGKGVEFDIDVTKVLRLRIDANPSGESGQCALGDIRLLGLPGEVPATS